MGFYAKVIADSVTTYHNNRITTLELQYPRFIHSEILTHRDRARNSSSSRAIPFPRLCERVLAEPVIPIIWGSEQKGMQAGQPIDATSQAIADKVWLEARDQAVGFAQWLTNLGVHKSLCNRLVEPWMWITVVMTATKWKNFFNLRCHPDAEPHFQKIAYMARDAIQDSNPQLLQPDQWHLPYVDEEDYNEIEAWLGTDDQERIVDVAKRASTARCARVSYFTHGENKKNLEKDVELCDRLIAGSGGNAHLSPFEHPAMAMHEPFGSGPFVGWMQYRKEIIDADNV